MKTASSLRVVKNPTTGCSLGSENIIFCGRLGLRPLDKN